jgi:GDP-L-fucose synthase
MKVALIKGVTGQDGAYLAFLIKDIVGFKGNVVFESSKPDGNPRKLTDTTRLNGLGWKYSIELAAGITNVYNENFLL